jgi:hypothetical protein
VKSSFASSIPRERKNIRKLFLETTFSPLSIFLFFSCKLSTSLHLLVGEIFILLLLNVYMRWFEMNKKLHVCINDEKIFSFLPTVKFFPPHSFARSWILNELSLLFYIRLKLDGFPYAIFWTIIFVFLKIRCHYLLSWVTINQKVSKAF